MGFKLYHGDCLEVMATLPDNSVDCVITDPPYGTTACKWDSVIPFEPMWDQLKRIAKPKAAICLFGSQPFTSALVMSNPKMFRYEWIWEKERPTNFLQGQRQALKYHENVNVFYGEQPTFNPQLREKLEVNKRNNAPRGLTNQVYGIASHKYAERCVTGGNKDWVYPRSVLPFSMQRGLHPTQKPVELLRYLIRTYTNEGETVLDFTMGSGSTGVACLLENRNFIGIEKDEGYFKIAEQRLQDAAQRAPLFAAA